MVIENNPKELAAMKKFHEGGHNVFPDSSDDCAIFLRQSGSPPS